MNRENLDALLYAFDQICMVKEDIEETGKHKRIGNRLDKACSELWIAIENMNDKLKKKGE